MKNRILGFLIASVVGINVALASFKEITDQITFVVSKSVFVLPNSLSHQQTQTCFASGITGPRIRLGAAIKWVGKGDLLPQQIKIQFNHPKLKATYTKSINPNSTDESIAQLFDGITTDFIPSGKQTHQTGTCFLDFGGLPFTVSELKGREELIVPAKITLSGVVRKDDREFPFSKSVDTKIIYVAGSVQKN